MKIELKKNCKYVLNPQADVHNKLNEKKNNFRIAISERSIGSTSIPASSSSFSL